MVAIVDGKRISGLEGKPSTATSNLHKSAEDATHPAHPFMLSILYVP